MHLAIFASGSGSNFQAIVDAVENDTLRANVVLCVTNHPDAGVLTRAERHAIPAAILDPSRFGDDDAYAAAILEALDAYGVDFVALAGFMRLVPAAVVRRFSGRMLNIHPALLPAFGGKGMYGRRVHRAVLASGVHESGATVHLVDEAYDTGPIVLQRAVPILPDDDPEALAARVLDVEHRIYPEALALFAEGRVHVSGRRVTIADQPV